jgi:hypothetical protein
VIRSLWYKQGIERSQFGYTSSRASHLANQVCQIVQLSAHFPPDSYRPCGYRIDPGRLSDLKRLPCIGKEPLRWWCSKVLRRRMLWMRGTDSAHTQHSQKMTMSCLLGPMTDPHHGKHRWSIKKCPIIVPKDEANVWTSNVRQMIFLCKAVEAAVDYSIGSSWFDFCCSQREQK